MKGIGATFKIDPDDDGYDLSEMGHLIDFPPGTGCSVIYYPPTTTATGGGFLSRNYDFPVTSLPAMFGFPEPAEGDPWPPVMSQPYIMEWYPTDGGYPSIAIHAFDTLAGSLDGMNSAGLAVSLLADQDAMSDLGPHWEPHPGPQQVVGLHELAVLRLLLDTCATVEEAKDALLTIKQYYRFMPCLYLVGDRDGQSFVYENSTGRNIQHLIDGTGGPQIASNFQLSTHPTLESVPDEPLNQENEKYWRYRRMVDEVTSHDGAFTVEDINTINNCVNSETEIPALSPDPTQTAATAKVTAGRTVWHSVYDQQAATLNVAFYLGEQEHPDGSWSQRHSDYLTLGLEAS